MKLEFKFQSSYGKSRYYPANPATKAIVDITGRKCLKIGEVQQLRRAGFAVDVIGDVQDVPGAV